MIESIEINLGDAKTPADVADALRIIASEIEDGYCSGIVGASDVTWNVETTEDDEPGADVFIEALRDIKRVKCKIKNLTFDEAGKQLAGYNADDELFDYNFGCICGTIYNDNGMASMGDDPNFEIYDWTVDEETFIGHYTLQEIKDKAK